MSEPQDIAPLKRKRGGKKAKQAVAVPSNAITSVKTSILLRYELLIIATAMLECYEDEQTDAKELERRLKEYTLRHVSLFEETDSEERVTISRRPLEKSLATQSGNALKRKWGRLQNRINNVLTPRFKDVTNQNYQVPTGRTIEEVLMDFRLLLWEQKKLDNEKPKETEDESVDPEAAEDVEARGADNASDIEAETLDANAETLGELDEYERGTPGEATDQPAAGAAVSKKTRKRRYAQEMPATFYPAEWNVFFKLGPGQLLYDIDAHVDVLFDLIKPSGELTCIEQRIKPTLGGSSRDKKRQSRYKPPASPASDIGSGGKGTTGSSSETARGSTLQDPELKKAYLRNVAREERDSRMRNLDFTFRILESDTRPGSQERLNQLRDRVFGLAMADDDVEQRQANPEQTEEHHPPATN